MELVLADFSGAGLEQQESCGGDRGGGCCRGAAEAGNALVCSVCTVVSNVDNDAGWILGRPDWGLTLGFDLRVRVRRLVRVRVRCSTRASLGKL